MELAVENSEGWKWQVWPKISGLEALVIGLCAWHDPPPDCGGGIGIGVLPDIKGTVNPGTQRKLNKVGDLSSFLIAMIYG